MAKTQFEKVGSNQIKVTVEFDAAEFDAAQQKAYERVKSALDVPGFRKGKVPRKVAEQRISKQLFYNDAIEMMIDDTFPAAIEESGETVVGEPTFKLEKADPTGVIYVAAAYVKPEVKLGEYTGLKYTKTEVSCDEEEIEEQIQAVREQNAIMHSVMDRAVKNEDVIKLDFVGTIDGEEFAGGKAEDYALAIGSGMFIPGFEEQLIGAMPGDDVTVKVAFPEDYATVDLRGKEAVFECHVREIIEAEFPEVTDEYVKNIADCDSVEEYREKMKEAILEAKQQEADIQRNQEVMDGLIANAEMDVPEVMIEEEVNKMVQGFINRLAEQGMEPENYFEVTGSSAEALKDEMKPHAEKKVRGKLALEQIAKEQGIVVSDEEVDEALADTFSQYEMTADDIKRVVGEAGLKNVASDIAKQKAQDWLIEQSVAVDAE